MAPADQPDLDHTTADLRSRLGARAFDAAFGEGGCLALGAAHDAADADPRLAGQPPGHLGLSQREREVLRLVAAGLSNPEVAERLYLSPRTIDAHLRRIYPKLGVAPRGAAIRFAVDHRLD